MINTAIIANNRKKFYKNSYLISLGNGNPILGNVNPKLGNGISRLGNGNPRLGNSITRLGNGNSRLWNNNQSCTY